MDGNCVKQQVHCIIMSDKGTFHGFNSCGNPQETCPRAGMKTGEGYELCKDICKQEHHAEVNACLEAGVDALGGTAFLFGHSYCCEDCLATMTYYGIADVYVMARTANPFHVPVIKHYKLKK